MQSRSFSERRQRLLGMLTRYAALMEAVDPPPPVVNPPPVAAESSSYNSNTSSSNNNTSNSSSSAVSIRNSPSPDLIDLDSSPAITACDQTSSSFSSSSFSLVATTSATQESCQQQQQQQQQPQPPSWEVFSNWYIARRADMAAVEKVAYYHLLPNSSQSIHYLHNANKKFSIHY